MAKKSKSKSPSVKKLVRKAGSDGNINNREAMKIVQATGASFKKVGNVAIKNSIGLDNSFTSGFGKKYVDFFNQRIGAMNSPTTGDPVDQNSTDPTSANPEETTQTVDVAPTMDQTVDSAGQFGAGSDVASFATGWKSRRGLRARAGRNAQGYSSMRIAPTYASGVGTNYG